MNVNTRFIYFDQLVFPGKTNLPKRRIGQCFIIFRLSPMALLADHSRPAALSSVANIIELTIFHYPLFFKAKN